MPAIEFVFTLILRIEQAVQIIKRAKKGNNSERTVDALAEKGESLTQLLTT